MKGGKGLKSQVLARSMSEATEVVWCCTHNGEIGASQCPENSRCILLTAQAPASLELSRGPSSLKQAKTEAAAGPRRKGAFSQRIWTHCRPLHRFFDSASVSSSAERELQWPWCDLDDANGLVKLQLKLYHSTQRGVSTNALLLGGSRAMSLHCNGSRPEIASAFPTPT